MNISKTIRTNLIVGGAFIVAPCMIGAMAGLAALTYRGDGGNWIFALGLAMVWAGLLWPKNKEPEAERFTVDEWEDDEDGVRFHGAGPDGRRGSFRVAKGSPFTVTKSDAA